MAGNLLRAAALAVAAALAPSAQAEESGLAGFYHVTPGGIGAGYSDHFALYEDGRWAFGNQYGCAEEGAVNDERVLARTGTWRTEDGLLLLTETERSVMRGGTCTCDAIACEITGGTLAVEGGIGDITVDPAAACISDHDPAGVTGRPLPCLTIDGTGYFLLGPAEELLP